MFSNKDVILITGGLGYIGSNLLKRLSGFDCKVYIITAKSKNIYGLRENYELFTCDITDYEKLNKYVNNINPNYIFHLAANTSRDISIEIIDSMVNVNIIGTLNLLKSCLTLDNLKSFVILGTCEEYGNNKTPYKENLKEDPMSPYSLSKTCSYYICKMFYNVYKIPVVYLRPSLVYGPGQPETMFISSLVSTLAKNKPFEMTLGEQTRNFIYINDLIEYLIMASTSKKCIGQIINIGNENIKIVDVARKIGQKMNKLHLIKAGTKEYRKNEIMRYEVDISKSIKLFKWKPQISLDKGLDKIIGIMKIHYHSDCYFFAGCENILVNLLNNKRFISENKISFSFPSFSYYKIGMKKRIREEGTSKYPIFLPDSSKFSYWLQKKNVQGFFRRLLGSPIYFLEQIYIFTLYDIVKLYFILKKIRPDVLHINNGGYPAAVSCRSAVIAAKFAKINKIIFHVNNVAEDPESYNKLKRIVERSYDKIINKNVDIFVTGSNYARIKLFENRKINLNKIINIANTFIPRRISETSDSLRKKLNLKEDDLIFGTVATLTKRKGHSVLIKAFDLLRKKTDEFGKIKLVIEGSGEEEARLRYLVNDLNLGDNILFIGDQENIFDIHNIFDVFVLPSIESEDFPNVIIESMSLGKPVIGTNLAGIPEEIENNVNGFIVEVNNEEELSDAMSKFIKDRNLIKKMGQKSKEIFEQKFEYNKTVQKILKLYQ